MMVKLLTRICVTRPQWLKFVHKFSHIVFLIAMMWMGSMNVNEYKTSSWYNIEVANVLSSLFSAGRRQRSRWYMRYLFKNSPKNLHQWTMSYLYHHWDSKLALILALHNFKLGQSIAANGQKRLPFHYNDVIMGAIASQITSLTIVYSIVYSDADQRKYQTSASLAFVRGIW